MTRCSMGEVHALSRELVQIGGMGHAVHKPQALALKLVTHQDESIWSGLLPAHRLDSSTLRQSGRVLLADERLLRSYKSERNGRMRQSMVDIQAHVVCVFESRRSGMQ